MAAILTERRPERAELLTALRRSRTIAAGEGRPAEAAMLEFLEAEVDRLLPTALAGARRLGTADQVVEVAAALPTLLHVRSLLRHHRHLLDDDFFGQLTALIRDGRPDLRDAAVRVLVVFGTQYGMAHQPFEARMYWAARCRDAGHRDRAMHHVNRALRLAGEEITLTQRAQAYVLIGTVHGERGNAEAAADAFTAALDAGLAARDMPTMQIRHALAGELRTLGMGQDAVDELTAALDEMPRYQADTRLLAGRCHHLRALVRDDLGDYDEAAEDFQIAVNLFVAVGDRQREFRARTDLAANLGKRGLGEACIVAFRAVKSAVDRWVWQACRHPPATTSARLF